MKRMFRLAAPLLAPLAMSACTNSGVDPSGLQPLTGEETASALAMPAPSREPIVPASTPAPGVTAAAATNLSMINTPATVQFAPVVGATEEAVSPLASRLAARAAQRGISVAGASGTAPTHVLKGYFSTFTEQRQTTIIYVWDVLDPSGNRLHRIQGRQSVAGVQGEGWNSVTPQTMEAIADRTIDELATWLVGSRG